jgi:hypothetical protein
MTNCVAFCDPAGGSGGDSMTLAWAHAEEKKVILDGVVEKRPPFSPRACAEEFSEILKRQGMSRVEGDRYSGGWVVEAFAECGITYVVSEKTKSQIYAAFLVLANSGLVQIPMHRRLIAQLRRLERRVVHGSGRESIDHPVGGRDDLSNAACGALVLAYEEGAEDRGPLVEYLSISEAPSKLLPEDWRTKPPANEERLWWRLN